MFINMVNHSYTDYLKNQSETKAKQETEQVMVVCLYAYFHLWLCFKVC